MNPQPPKESHLTPEQRKSLRRIQSLLNDFHRGMVTVVYRGTDNRLHIQTISNAKDKAESLDLARRTMQEIEKVETGIITTLTSEERRIVE